MGESSKSQNSIKFKYIFPDDYNPVYVNGAVGGISPRGEIVINFFFERQGLPKSQTYELSAEGTLGNEIAIEPEEPKIIRYIQNGIILHLDKAKEIHKWFGELIQKLEKLQSEEKTGKDVTEFDS